MASPGHCCGISRAVQRRRQRTPIAPSSRRAKAASPPWSMARSFRLDDGREVRLAGIERAGTDKASARTALATLVSGRHVTLHGEDDAPDRYGRQPAFVFADGSETSVQGEMLRRGEALVSDRSDRQGLRGSAGRRRDGGAAGQIGNLDSPHRHKKRGKSGRYSGRDGAIYGGRGQSFVRSSSGGCDLPEFRA